MLGDEDDEFPEDFVSEIIGRRHHPADGALPRFHGRYQAFHGGAESFAPSDPAGHDAAIGAGGVDLMLARVRFVAEVLEKVLNIANGIGEILSNPSPKRLLILWI